jgi:hypothetical protein
MRAYLLELPDGDTIMIELEAPTQQGFNDLLPRAESIIDSLYFATPIPG